MPLVDTIAYDKKMEQLANNKFLPSLWPASTVYPNAGAILPFKRVVAYYGNLYSTQMGVLGEYGEEEMLAKLNEEVKNGKSQTRILPLCRRSIISRLLRRV